MGATQHLDEKKGGHKERKTSGGVLSISQLNDWLESNYELKEGACLPRCLIYAHYLEYCRSCDTEPLGPAIFGKAIRTQFRSLTSRRLGTRGQSKYHYHGLAIKTGQAEKGRKATHIRLTRFTESSANSQERQQNKKGSTEIDSMLDEFARVKRVRSEGQSQNVQDKINTFLVIYEAHCQRILDTVVAANFDDVESSLLHFWCSMPWHVTEILQEGAITEIVAAFDTILYKKINDIIIPSSLQDCIPASFRIEVSKFIKSFLPWLDICLMNVPKELAVVKMKVAKSYIKLIERQLAFLSFSQPVKAILVDCQQTQRILQDLESINFTNIVGIKTAKIVGVEKLFVENVEKLFNDVVDLLRRKAPIDFFLFILDKFIYDVMIQPCEKSNADIKLSNKEFILNFSQILSKVMEDLTLTNASTFGSIHIMNSMILEYIFMALESKAVKDQEIAMWTDLAKVANEETKGNKRVMNWSNHQEPVRKCPRLLDKRVYRKKSKEVSTKFTVRHSFELSQNAKLEAAQEKINQSNPYNVNHCTSAIDSQSSCVAGKQEIYDNDFGWMSSLPSFQDLVAINNLIDLQGNEVVYPEGIY